jgi:hypothetical protein
VTSLGGISLSYRRAKLSFHNYAWVFYSLPVLMFFQQGHHFNDIRIFLPFNPLFPGVVVML